MFCSLTGSSREKIVGGMTAGAMFAVIGLLALIGKMIKDKAEAATSGIASGARTVARKTGSGIARLFRRTKKD